MPEQITKYPDVTMKVLEGAGATCGAGAPQKILTECPRDQFCALSSGEVCVYGIPDIPRMTQIAEHELAGVVCPAAQSDAGATTAQATLAGDAAWAIAVFAGGFLLGALWKRFWPSRE